MAKIYIQPNTYDKFEAIKLMMEGKKMTHPNFTNNEWITIEGAKFKFEDGCKCYPEEFWKYRTDNNWLVNWSIKL